MSSKGIYVYMFIFLYMMFSDPILGLFLWIIRGAKDIVCGQEILDGLVDVTARITAVLQGELLIHCVY